MEKQNTLQRKNGNGSNNEAIRSLLNKNPGNAQSTNVSRSNSLYSEDPETVAQTFNIVPSYYLLPMSSVPVSSNTVTGLNPFQSAVHFNTPNINVQEASGTIDQSHFHNGMSVRPVSEIISACSNRSLNNNSVSGSSLETVTNSINLGTSSSIVPCGVFVNNESGFRQVSTLSNVMNFTQKKIGDAAVPTGKNDLAPVPDVDINASGINGRDAPQVQDGAKVVQTAQKQHFQIPKEQLQAVNYLHGNQIAEAATSHSFKAVPTNLYQNDANCKSRSGQYENVNKTIASSSKGSEHHLAGSERASNAQDTDLKSKQEAKVNTVHKVSSSIEHASKDKRTSVYSTLEKNEVAPGHSVMEANCGNQNRASTAKNRKSISSGVKSSKPAFQTSRSGSPAISSKNTAPCQSDTNIDQTDSEDAIIDVENEDIEDCMLVSIDLSKQMRPIGAKIHNIQVVIDSDEDELNVTSSGKEDSISKQSEQVLENQKTLDFPCDAETSEGIRSGASKLNPQDGVTQPSSVNCLEADALNTEDSADNGKDDSFRAREDGDIEIYIDKDIKEERPFIDPEIWQPNDSEILTERLDKSTETNLPNHEPLFSSGPSEVFTNKCTRIGEVNSTSQDILSAARANFSQAIDEVSKDATSSSSATKVNKKVEFASSLKTVGWSKTKKSSANCGAAKKSFMRFPDMLNSRKHSTVTSDITNADSTATYNKAASDNSEELIIDVINNFNPEPIAPEITDSTQNGAFEGVPESEKGTSHVEIKNEPIESEMLPVDVTFNQVEPTENTITSHGKNHVSSAPSDSTASIVSKCLKCRRSFTSAVSFQEHLSCSLSCKSYNQKLQTQHKPKDKGCLSCVVCKHTSCNIDTKFHHVAHSLPCFKRYASLCMSCNATINFFSERDRMEQIKTCRKKHLMVEPLTSSDASISVDQIKTKQNTGLLLMSAGVATLSSVNTSTSCTVRCEGCSAWFSSYARFKLHVHAQQSCKSYYDRHFSNKPMPEEDETNRKEGKASNKPIILCPLCSKKFATNAMLTIHLNENTSCKSKFVKYSTPKIAKRGKPGERNRDHRSAPSSNVHPLDNDKSPPKKNKLDDGNYTDLKLKEMVIKLSPKSIMCAICHKPFFDATALSKHLALSQSCTDNSGDIRFQCQGCNKYFIGDAGLAKHIQRSMICQAKIDSNMMKPTEPCASGVDASRNSLKPQKVHVLNVDLLDSEQNERVPEVIRTHESLGKHNSCIISQKSDSETNKNELNEIADELSSEESEEDSSSCTSSDEADVEFKCKTCNKTFSEKMVFKQHMMQHRSGPGTSPDIALQKIKCKACRKKLKSLKEFQAHLLKRSFCFLKVTKKLWYKNHGEMMSCKMCNKVLKNVRDLGKHCFKNMTCRLCYVDAVLKTFTNSSSTKCEEAAPLESRGVYNKDISSFPESLETNKEQNLSRPVLQEGSLSFECELCHVVFDSRYKFQLHFFNQKPDCLYHYATLGPQFQAQVPYCFRCKNRFINIHKLRTHKCIGYRRYVQVCGHCNFKFPSLATLEAHAQNNEHCTKALEAQIQEKSGGKTSLMKKSKDVARKTTTQMSNSLKVSKTQRQTNLEADELFEGVDKVGKSGRKASSHSKFVEEFSCRVCLRKFPTLSLLLEHSYEHTEEKQYDCKRCGFMCYRYNRLVSHEAVHERLDKECGHFNDRLDLHSVVVQDSANSDFEMNDDTSDTNEQFFDSATELKDSQKKVCIECGKSFESLRALKKHLACSVRCRKKSGSQSHSDVSSRKKTLLVKKESQPVTALNSEQKKEDVPKLRPSVRIVTKMGSSGKRFLTATPVQEIPRGEHLFCFFCRRFLKSKEEIERHSFHRRHAVLSRKLFNKAVWLPGKYSCKICKNKVLQKGSLVRHMINCHKNVESVAATAPVGEKLKKTDNKETISTNSIGSRASCSLCKKYITNNSKKTHFMSHLTKLKTDTRVSSSLPLTHPSKEYCKICRLPLASRRGLLNHLDRHREEDIFSTPYCSSQEILTGQHKNDIFKHPSITYNGRRLKPRATPGRCKLCQKQFLNFSVFRQHFKLTHSHRYPKPAHLYFIKSTEDKAIKKFPQPIKNLKPSYGSFGKKMNFSTLNEGKQKSVATHSSKHKAKHVCKMCDCAFLRRRYLRRHIQIYHEDCLPELQFLLTDKDYFICKICGAKHNSLKGFKIHLASKHKEVDAINSMICDSRSTITSTIDAEPGFSFRKRRVLECHLCTSKVKAVMYGKHLMMKHNWSKKSFHTCSYCKVDFPSAIYLQTHTLQCKKDCCCHLCGKQIASVRGLRNHIILHHKWHWDKYTDEFMNGDGNAVEKSKACSSLTTANSNTGCDLVELKDKASLLSHSSQECHECKRTFGDTGLFLEHMQTHIIPCKVNLGKKNNVQAKDIEVTSSSEEHADPCSAIEQEMTMSGTSLKISQVSSGTSLFEEMADSSNSQFPSSPNEVNLPASEQAIENLDQEAEISGSILDRTGPTNDLPLSDQNNLDPGLRNPDITFAKTEMTSIGKNVSLEMGSSQLYTDPKTTVETCVESNQIDFDNSVKDSSQSLLCQSESLFESLQQDHDVANAATNMRSETLGNANPGNSNNLKRKLSNKDVGAVHMNTEKRKKNEICSPQENNEKNVVEEVVVQNNVPLILSHVDRENKSVQGSNTGANKGSIVSDNSIDGSQCDESCITGTCDDPRNDAQGSGASSSKALTNAPGLHSNTVSEELAQDIPSYFTSSEAPQARVEALDEMYSKGAQDIIASSTSNKNLDGGNNTDVLTSVELTRDCMQDFQPSSTSSKESEPKKTHQYPVVQVKLEKPDPEFNSEDRNVFSFFNESVDFVEEEDDDLQFLSFEKTTLEDFVKPRSPVNVNQNFDVNESLISDTNLASSSEVDVEASEKYHHTDSHLNSSNLSDN
ncbi:hypothetical protein EGW08_007463 [Elysia chlorotica]|uniref:C2H2-type domain-containing protein n=1 Tax=Elysia chlorotica TaxID=188477 RepID=A0A433TT47_ELYCH|nr:hypothetical protein EGW08_007463 [Elysia chlorotica]